jgi:hypothetical protein
MTISEKTPALIRRFFSSLLFYLNKIGNRVKLLAARTAAGSNPSKRNTFVVKDPANPSIDSVPVVCRDAGPPFGRAGVPTAEGETIFGADYETEDHPSQGRL